MKNNLQDILIDGLMTDSAHHKQWFLERALKLVVGEEEFDMECV